MSAHEVHREVMLLVTQQLDQMADNCAFRGVSPVTAFSASFQICLSFLSRIDPASTAAMARAYADLLESGGQQPAKAAAEARFDRAANDFMLAEKSYFTFPPVQGRA